jgi:hypothetical protein
MKRTEKLLTALYTLLYAAGIWIVCMDVTTWRKHEPSGAQVQAKAMMKAAR